jgi:hypothetical protein
MPVFNAIERPTALVTITDEGSGPLRADVRTGGIGEIRVLSALIWTAANLKADIINRAIVSCGTNDPETLVAYLNTQTSLEIQDIRDILGNI